MSQEQSPATHDGLQRPYSVYEDYEGKLYIIDKDGRIVLRDEFAYDDGSEARDMRMDKLADALNASAPSETAPLVAGDLAKQREIHDTYAPVSAIGEWRPMIELPGVLLRTEMLFKTEHHGRDGLTHTHHEILLVWPDGVLTDHTEAVVPPEETPTHFMRIPK